MRRIFESPQRLVQVLDDIVDMLDPDAKADHFRPNAGFAKFIGAHLPMGRRRGVASERLDIADVHEALDQPQAIIEFPASFKPAFNSEREQ
jgi:hypothetical protein